METKSNAADAEGLAQQELIRRIKALTREDIDALVLEGVRSGSAAAMRAHMGFACRQISFESSPIERALPTPELTAEAIASFAGSEKWRFPSLREKDL